MESTKDQSSQKNAVLIACVHFMARYWHLVDVNSTFRNSEKNSSMLILPSVIYFLWPLVVLYTTENLKYNRKQWLSGT